MSAKLLKAVWESALPQPMKTVLTILAWYGQGDGVGIFPSVETVARYTSYSKRNVHSIIREAIQFGILIPVKRRGTQHGYITEYKMDISRFPALPGREALESALSSAYFEGDENVPPSADLSLQSPTQVCTPEPLSAHSSAEDKDRNRRKKEQQGGIEQRPSLPLCLQANHLIEELGVPNSQALKEAVREAIRTKAKRTGMTLEEAKQRILARAIEARDDPRQSYSRKNWRFWFEDEAYDKPF